MRLHHAALIALLLSGAGSLFGEQPGESARRVDADVLTALRAAPAKGPVHIAQFPLGDGTEADLELTPFRVWAPGARIVLHDGQRERDLPIPDVKYLRGKVAGYPDSLVILAAGDVLRGFVFLDDGSSPWRPNATFTAAQRREIPPSSAPSTPSARRRLVPGLPVPRAAGAASLLGPGAARVRVGAAPPEHHDVRGERRPRHGLRALLPLRLERRGDHLRERSLRRGFGHLPEGRQDADPGELPVALVHLFGPLDRRHVLYRFDGAGRLLARQPHGHHADDGSLPLQEADGGGTAWIGVLCSDDFFCSGGLCGSPAYDNHYGGGYGASAINGQFSTTNPSLYWDILVTTHEIGHNFSSRHTHDYVPPVDTCCSGGVCNGTVPPEKGTIMSYCHLLSGGYNNIKLFFGVVGEPSEAVLTKMRTYVEGRSHAASCMPEGSAAAASLYTLSPCRVLDTRDPNGSYGGPILAGSGSQRSFSVAGTCGVPSGATSVSTNVTVTGPAADGSLKIFPAGGSVPTATVVSFPAGVTRANNATVFLSATGAFTVQSDGGATHFILDVNGYYQ